MEDICSMTMMTGLSRIVRPNRRTLRLASCVVSIIWLATLCRAARSQSNATAPSLVVDRTLYSYELGIETLSRMVQNQYESFCTTGVSGPSACVPLSCETQLNFATCTNDTLYGNLFGLGCKNCTGRQIDDIRSSVQTNNLLAKPGEQELDISWTDGVRFRRVTEDLLHVQWQHLTVEDTGLTRTFPGFLQNFSVCSTDARLYPRYAAALSSLKDIVIIIDNNMLRMFSTLTIAAVNNVLGTLTDFDEVALVTFDHSARIVLTGVEGLQVATQRNIGVLKIQLEETAQRARETSKTSIVDYKNAFREGFRILYGNKRILTRSSCRRSVVVFISEGSHNFASLDNLIQEFNTSIGDSFTSILSYSTAKDNTLESLSNLYGGIHTEVMDVSTLPNVVSQYYKYLWALASMRQPSTFWSGLQTDAPTKSQYFTLSRPVFWQGTAANNDSNVEQTIQTLVGVVAFDVQATAILDEFPGSKDSAMDTLETKLLARSGLCNSSMADACSVWRALSPSLRGDTQSSTFSTTGIHRQCDLQHVDDVVVECNMIISRTRYSQSLRNCTKRSDNRVVPCCDLRNSNCTTDDGDDSSGVSVATIISISVWMVIICAYPFMAALNKFVHSEWNCCRRNRRSRTRNVRVTRNGNVNRSRPSTQPTNEVEVELEDYASRELTNAPPPSYNIALETTLPTSSPTNSIPSPEPGSFTRTNNTSLSVGFDDATEPPPGFDEVAAMPPPSYDELGT
ncbi:uncharacterized protein LOC135808293 isoform X1 [Sycon ciliatum]|uniref:uncharacterized protein LOC135808293 isoform X1 n=1 Tax=Sycon ciliatum TaxID=27933 RepID=UPI0031F6A187